MVAKSQTDTIVSLPSDREIMFERVFDAPRDLVFKVCMDPRHIPHWWGPRKYVTTVEKMDVRPGGVWRFVQRDADGSEFAFHGEYREVTPPERVVATFEFEGMPGHVVVDTTTFEEQNGKTKMTVTSLFESVEDRDGMLQSGMESGMRESWDRLAGVLVGEKSGTRTLVITRIFDAPRELVWKAWTESEHLMRWWGPKHFTAPVWRLDLRVGGSYLYCMRSPEGQDYCGTGIFQEIVPPERLVYTDSFADEQGRVVPASHYGLGANFPRELHVTMTLEDM